MDLEVFFTTAKTLEDYVVNLATCYETGCPNSEYW